MGISKKIFIVFMAVMIIFATMQCVISNATEEPAPAAEGAKKSESAIMGTITSLATSEADGDTVTSVNTIAGAIISIAQVICAGVAVIMITVIAMKYMMAAPSEKADIKKHAVVYVVGAVVMFAATAILQIIQNFAKVLE